MRSQRREISGQQIEQAGAGQERVAAALRPQALRRAPIHRLSDAGRRDGGADVERLGDAPNHALRGDLHPPARNQRRANAGQMPRLGKAGRAVNNAQFERIGAGSVRDANAENYEAGGKNGRNFSSKMAGQTQSISLSAMVTATCDELARITRSPDAASCIW